MSNNDFEKLVKKVVADYSNEHNSAPDKKPISEDDVYIVWSCKTLQNNKALASTPLHDGMYYEVTYNGDKVELYLDAYKKKENRCYGGNFTSACKNIASAASTDRTWELSDTAFMMLSPDYKERFKAEYIQLKIRLDKLSAMLEKHRAGSLSFIPTCPISLLEEQESVMKMYRSILLERAKIEGITIE